MKRLVQLVVDKNKKDGDKVVVHLCICMEVWLYLSQGTNRLQGLIYKVINTIQGSKLVVY